MTTIRLKLLFLLALVNTAACAPSGNAEVGEGDVTADGSSARLNTELFDDADPSKDDAATYVLVGRIPKSSKGCAVTIRRRGLKPPANASSMITVYPLAK